MAVDLRKSGMLALKGVAMGAADVVPGVSGGTIAFIAGIYQELIRSLQSLNLESLRKLFKEGIGAFWSHINGRFLLPLFLGIGTSIVSLARGISYLLANHPELLWAFFFGLILASIVVVGKTVQRWNAPVFVALVIGSLVSYYITTITTVADETTNLSYILLCGMVSICAMILPGISGSFILLLMGAYELVIGTIKDLASAVGRLEFGEVGTHLKIAGTFAVGAVVGLISFSHALSWLFKRFHDTTIAVLLGFLVGSLNKIWPWKETLTTRVKHAGQADEQVLPFIQGNVMPWDYASVNTVEASQLGLATKDPNLLGAAGLLAVGFTLIILLEKLGSRSRSTGPT